MKLLLTGGCGFIGSAVIRHLMRHTDHVVINVDKMTYAASQDALEDPTSQDAPQHPASQDAPQGTASQDAPQGTASQDAPQGTASHHRHLLIKADIADAAAMRQVFATHDPDAVMHLAAESHVDRSIDGPADFVHTNVVGTFILLEAARRHHDHLPPARKAAFRFHHVSTDEVFGALQPGAPPFTEQTPYDPRSPYSATKAASDHLVRAWSHTYKLPTLVSNTCNNYGPWQFPEKLIPLVTLNALEAKDLPVYGDGSNIRDWLFVEDHAQALVRIIENGTPGETYAIGGRQPRTNLQVVKAICDHLDKRVPDPAGPRQRLIRFVSDRPGHDFRYEIDPSRSEQALDWKAPHDFETGLARTIDWYLANRPWWQTLRSARYAGQRLGTANTPPTRAKEENIA